jgi:glycosyltransferase involved in cell wall biosynthesis
MLIAAWILGIMLALVWAGRAFESVIKLRTVADISEPQWNAKTSGPRTTVVVPARNEQEAIESCLCSLLAQDYADLEIIAVDDRSTDSTGAVMDRLAAQHPDHLRVIHIADLPVGWLGKTHAMWLAAKHSQSEWILFTDGDILFHPETISRAIEYAEQVRADHVVLYATPEMHGMGEHMILGFFCVISQILLRPWKVAEHGTREHIGFGAFNLVRRSAYEAVGTYEALRLKVIDDISLGKRIKHHGFSQQLIFGKGLLKLRWAKGALGVMLTLEKNFFALFRFNIALALAAAIGTIILNAGPYVGAIAARGWLRLPYAIALAGIAYYYVVVARRFKRELPPCFFLHPLASVLVAITILNSAIHALTNRGIIWRGTKYSLKQLRDFLN